MRHKGWVKHADTELKSKLCTPSCYLPVDYRTTQLIFSPRAGCCIMLHESSVKSVTFKHVSRQLNSFLSRVQVNLFIFFTSFHIICERLHQT